LSVTEFNDVRAATVASDDFIKQENE